MPLPRLETTSVRDILDQANDEIREAQRLLQETQLASMNKIADALCEAGTTPDIGPFLMAMHGVVGEYCTDKDRPAVQKEYEAHEERFGVGHIGVIFGPTNSRRPPYDVLAFSRRSFDERFEPQNRAPLRSDFSAVEYAVTRNSYGSYIGLQLVPAVFAMEFRKPFEDQKVDIRDYVLAKVERKMDSVEPYGITHVPTAFSNELAGWASGHHPSRHAQALSDVAEAESRLQEAMVNLNHF